MDFVDVMKNNIVEKWGDFRLCKSIFFGDTGHSLSIQACGSAYCTPREMIPLDEYTHFEVMTNLPDEDIPESWSEYGNTDDVFGWVPKGVVEQLITNLVKKYGEMS